MIQSNLEAMVTQDKPLNQGADADNFLGQAELSDQLNSLTRN